MPMLFSEKDKLRSDTKSALTDWGINVTRLAAKKGVPLLLVGRDSIKKTVMDYIDTHEFTKAYVFGGEGVISNILEVK